MIEIASPETLSAAVPEQAGPALPAHEPDHAQAYTRGHVYSPAHPHTHPAAARGPLALSLMAQPAWVRVAASAGVLVLLWLAILWAVMLP